MNIEERIRNAKLTKSERKVLNFIMIHKEEACYFTTAELAQVIQVSNTTVLRAANKLGYGRFAEFRRELQEEVLRLTNRSQSMLQSPELLQDVKRKSTKDIINQCSAIMFQNLHESLIKNTYDTYNAITDLILGARKLIIIGFRTAEGCVVFFGSLLKLTRGNVICLTNPGNISEELYDLGEEDLAIVISYPRYSENILISLDIIQKKKCRLVVMTDEIGSPIAVHSDYILLSGKNGISFFNSYVSMMANIEILLSLVSKKNFQDTEERLTEREEYLKRNKQY